MHDKITNKPWIEFVRLLCELGVTNNSKEIANVINKKTGDNITWFQVAGVKAHYAKENRKNK